MLKGGQDLTRKINRLHVLRTIRQHEPVSRFEIAELTGFASTTVGAIADELIAEGLLTEARAPARQQRGRGRPRQLLSLNPDGALVAGVFVFPLERIIYCLTNLRGDVIAQIEDPALLPASADDLATAIAKGVREVTAAAGKALADIQSVGVAVPGMVESHAGIVHWLPMHIDAPTPLGRMIEDRIGRPVLIDNDVNIVARAERWFGEGPQADDFALVVVGAAISMAQYVQGQLNPGEGRMNVEFGHIKVDRRDPFRCYCGARGCLTTFSSVIGMLERTVEGGDILEVLRRADAAFADLVARARGGEAAIRALLDQGGDMLGLALANIINLTDVKRLILIFPSALVKEAMEATMRRSLEENTLAQLRGRSELIIHTGGFDRWAQGAAALALEHLYAAPRH
jgi:predicted NBD/HSP70 family sugar kinase